MKFSFLPRLVSYFVLLHRKILKLPKFFTYIGLCILFITYYFNVALPFFMEFENDLSIYKNVVLIIVSIPIIYFFCIFVTVFLQKD